jgi:hypothetical protein
LGPSVGRKWESDWKCRASNLILLVVVLGFGKQSQKGRDDPEDEVSAAGFSHPLHLAPR